MSDLFRKTLDEVCSTQGWECSEDAVQIPLEDGRSQTLHYKSFDFEGQSLVRLHTAIGDASRMHVARLTQGLRMTFKLPHGALALKDDALVVVDTVSAEDSAEAIAAIARYLVETADHLEATMFGIDAH